MLPSLHRSSWRATAWKSQVRLRSIATGRSFPSSRTALKVGDIAPAFNPLRPIGSRGAAPGFDGQGLLIGRSMRTLHNITNFS